MANSLILEKVNSRGLVLVLLCQPIEALLPPFFSFTSKVIKQHGPDRQYTGADLRRTLLCYGVIGTQSGSGTWFLVAFQTYLFTVAGITKPFEFSIMNNCLGFLASSAAASFACLVASHAVFAISPWPSRGPSNLPAKNLAVQ